MIQLKNKTLNLLHSIRKYVLIFFNRLARKSTLGVTALVVNSDNKVLLVTHTYQPGWYLPGGGVKNKEPFITAVIREVREETGVEVIGDPELYGVYLRMAHGVSDYSALFVIKNFQQFSQSSPEIKAIGWFDLNQLPKDTTAGTRRRLQEFFQGTSKSLYW